jgi:hypothetical protein
MSGKKKKSTRTKRRTPGPLTAAELIARLNADEAYLAREEAEVLRMAERGKELSRAEQPLMADLEKAGFDLESVWDLVNTATPYPGAIPTLLAHIVRPYPDRVREGIARALAVPESRMGWSVLIDEYRKSSDQTTFGAKYALGLALAAAADDEVLDDVLSLLREPAHGECRSALIPVLERSSSPKARKALMELGSVPSLAKRAQQALARIQKRQSRRRRNSSR